MVSCWFGTEAETKTGPHTLLATGVVTGNGGNRSTQTGLPWEKSEPECQRATKMHPQEGISVNRARPCNDQLPANRRFGLVVWSFGVASQLPSKRLKSLHRTFSQGSLDLLENLQGTVGVHCFLFLVGHCGRFYGLLGICAGCSPFHCSNGL